MEKSILFFDIDGTIVSEDGRHIIPKSTRDALKQARENGHIIMVNTGRTSLIVDKNVRELGFSGLICGCGTQIILDDKEILRHKNDAAKCREIADLFEKLKISAIFEGADQMGYNKDLEINDELRSMIDLFEQMNYRMITTDSNDFYFDKLFCWARDDESFEEFESVLSKDFGIIRRGDTGIIRRCEVVPKGYSKATGMEFVMKKLGIPRERSFAFGDSTNDLPMLEYAAHSAAMGGCPPDVAQKVEFVTDTLYNDGLANAMKRFKLI